MPSNPREFKTSELVDKVSNFSDEEDDTISDEDALDLHNLISGHIAASDVYYNIDVSNLKEETINNINQAQESGDTETVTALQKQLDALNDLSSLMESQGKVYAESFLNREKLGREQAEELVSYLDKISDIGEVLGDAVNLPITEFLELQSKNILDDRLSTDYRKSVVDDLVSFIRSNDAAKDSVYAKSIEELYEIGKLDNQSFMQIADNLKYLRKDLDLDSSIQEVSKTLIGESNREVMEEKLDKLLSLMRSSSKYEEEHKETIRLLNKENKISNDEFMTSVSMLSDKLSDNTMETKINYSLNELNDNFDSSVLSNENLSSKFEGMKKTFLENSEKVASATAGAVPALASIVLSGLFGPIAGLAGALISPHGILAALAVSGGVAMKGLSYLMKGLGGLGGGVLSMIGMGSKESGVRKRFVESLKKVKWLAPLIGLATAAGLLKGGKEVIDPTVDMYKAFTDANEIGEEISSDADNVSNIIGSISTVDTLLDIEAGKDVDIEDSDVDELGPSNITEKDKSDGLAGADIATGVGVSVGAGSAAAIAHHTLNKRRQFVKPPTPVPNTSRATPTFNRSNVGKLLIPKVSLDTEKIKSGAKTAAKIGGRAIWPLVTAYQVGSAESRHERLKTIAGGVGGFGGGLVGSIAGPLAIPGAIGGYFAGEALADKIIHPKHRVPYHIQKMGKLYEAFHITQHQYIDDDNWYDDLDAEGNEELLEYRDSLLTKDNMEDYLMSSGLQNYPKEERVGILSKVLMHFGIDEMLPGVYSRLLDMQQMVNDGTLILKKKRRLIRPVRTGGITPAPENQTVRSRGFGSQSNVAEIVPSRQNQAIFRSRGFRPQPSNVDSVDTITPELDVINEPVLPGNISPRPVLIPIQTLPTTPSPASAVNQRPIIINNSSGGNRSNKSPGGRRAALYVDDYSIALANNLIFT